MVAKNFWVLGFFVVWPGLLWPSSLRAIKLGPAQVAELVIKNSPRAREIQLSPEVARINYIRALQVLDWHIQFDSNLEESRFEPFSGLPFNTGQDTLQSQLAIQKNLLTGTQLQINVLHTSTRFDLAAGSVLPPTVNVWTSSIGFTQNLWRNYFGESWRKEIAAQEKLYEVAKMQRLEDLENLVAEGVQRFWGVVTAELSLKEALATRDRYQLLLNNVRKKQAVGFANPGELAQVQAELESREQSIYRAEVTLQELREQFFTFLSIDRNQNVEWNYLRDIQSLTPYEPQDFEVERIRPYRLAELRREAAEKAMEAAKANQGMDVSLVGQYGIAGVDKLSEVARQEWLRADRPRYFVGVRLQWDWGSDVRQEEYQSRRASLEQEQVRLSRLRQELEDRKQVLKKKMATQYRTIQSLSKQKNFRMQAVRELTRSYELGKIEIRTLIEAINGAFLTELEYLKAIGDYQTVIVEWLALKDELIIPGS